MKQAAELLVESTGTDISKGLTRLEKLIINKRPVATLPGWYWKGVGISKEFNVLSLSMPLLLKTGTKAYR